MKPSAFALSCVTLLLVTPILAHAAIRFDPLRLVSAADPAVEPWATPNGDSFGMQLAPDGAWVLFVSDASNITTNQHQAYTLDLYLYEPANQKTTLISVDPAGAGGGDARTAVGHATPDGRFVAFVSEASNLVPGVDANFSSDIFVRDLTAGTTRLVSMNWQGAGSGLGDSVDPFITPDGRYVAFASAAEDIVEGDSNGLADVFVRDLLEESTELISVGSASSIFDPDYFYGSGGPQLSADGRWVAFSSTATNMVPGVTNLHGEIYLRDRSQGTTMCPSQVAFDQWAFSQETPPFRRRAFNPSLSEDGGYLVFIAEFMYGPPNYVTAARSLWRFETASGEATLITTNVTWGISMEQTTYTMSPDGRWVAFLTSPNSSSNDIELWDGDTGNTILATPALDGVTGANGYCDMPELSADGRFLVFTSLSDNLVTNAVAGDGDVNVFIRDLVDGHTTLISSDATGTALGDIDLAFPAISHDGNWVTFDSYQGGFVPDDRNRASDVFLHERETGVIELVSRVDPAAQSASGNGHSQLRDSPFSDDGARLLFRSESDDLAPGLSGGLRQIYVHEWLTSTRTLVSVNTAGDAVANTWTSDHVISGDGQSVAYTSVADNLVQEDSNDWEDVFVRDLVSQSTVLISRSQSGASGNSKSSNPALSHDGNRVGFLSYATDLVEPEPGFMRPYGYIHDRQGQTTILVTDPSPTSFFATSPKISPDGRYFAYANQRWPYDPIYLYDYEDGESEELLPGAVVAFSRDGRYFVTLGPDSQGRALTSLIRRDLASGIDESLSFESPPGLSRANIALDDSGRFIAFASYRGLVSADTNQLNDVYLLDFESHALTLISLNAEGTAAGGGESRSPSISGDGRLVAFDSEADDLVPNDTNGMADVFVFDRYAGTLAVVSANPEGSVGDERSGNPHLSPHGYRLAFTSLAADLVAGDHNSRIDVFLTTMHPNLIADTDDDGMADDWETNHFSGLQALPEVDSDVDGFLNLAEYIAGTDPLDPLSHLRIEIATDESNKVRLHWTAVPGRTYAVESRFDLVSGEWTAMPGVVGIAGALAQFEAVESGEAPTYYRLQVTNDTGP